MEEVIPTLHPRALRETLQTDLLEVLGIYGVVGVQKQMVAVRTSAWYRQQKFNLLREETEGFAKLFTELTTFFLTPASHTNLPLLIKKIQAFIGFFDLDPNRVIDLVLDAFEKSGLGAQTGQMGNFLKVIDLFQKENVLQLLGFKFRNYYDQYVHAQQTGAKVSSLIGVAPQSLYDLAAVLIKTGRISSSSLYSHLSPSDELMALARSDLLEEERKKQGKANVVSLGGGKGEGEEEKGKKGEVKLANIDSKARNDGGIVSSGVPMEKEEISLVLTGTPIPALQMEIERQQLTTPVVTATAAAPSVASASKDAMPPPSAKVGIRGTSQSTATSALLPSSAAAASVTPAALPAAPAPLVPNHPNQKFGLIAALLNQNAWTYAQVLLDHLNGLQPSANPAVGGALVDFVARMVRPLYTPISSEWRRFATHKTKQPAPLHVSAKEDHSHSVDALPKGDHEEIFRWTLLREEQVEEQFPQPLALEVYQRAIPTVQKLLKYLGVYLCNDVMLWTRLCRVIAYVIRTEKAQHKRQRSASGDSTAMVDVNPPDLPSHLEYFLTDLLFPAFALLPSCHGSSEELWAILKQLKYEVRYRMYGHWHSTLYESCPEMQQLKSSVLHRARYFRKRIAAAKVKECSRLLVKFAENNALLVFELLLQQIQSFDNMIGPVTEIMKLLHPLAFDCVAFVLMKQLADEKKPKLSEDGMNENHWLQSLSTFAGVMYQRYPEVELTPLIQFVLNRLKSQESIDLLILKNLLVGMSNIEIHEEVSQEEMDGRAGGRLIQLETTTVRDKNKNKGKATKAILETILKHRMVLPLWVAVAQQKQHIAFGYESEHVKLIAEMYDKCHEALLHITAFAEQTLAHSDAQYAGQFCSLEELVSEYHVKPSDAFHVLRRVLKERRMQAKEKDGTDNEDVEMGERKENEAAVKQEVAIGPYSALITCVRGVLPDTVWQSITPTFYALFWRLSLSNLYVPTAAYEGHVAKLKALIPALDSPTAVGTNTLAGAPKTDLQRRQSKQEKERLLKVITALGEELKQQTLEVAAISDEIKREKDTWFDASITHHAQSMSVFLQHCILPRVLHSGIDAHYTAKFLSTVLKLNTRHFAYLDLFDHLFKSLGALISSSSTNEASRAGRFLKEMMGKLHAFAYDEAKYQKLVATSPNCFLPIGSTSDDMEAPVPFSFAHVTMEVKKFHLRLSKIFGKFLQAPSTKMETNNALLLLCAIGSEWPRTVSQGLKIESLLEAIMSAEENKNTALKLMATGSHAQLQKQRKTWIRDIPLPQQKTITNKPDRVDKGDSATAEKPAAAVPKPAAAEKPAAAASKPAAVRDPSPSRRGESGSDRARTAGNGSTAAGTSAAERQREREERAERELVRFDERNQATKLPSAASSANAAATEHDRAAERAERELVRFEDRKRETVASKPSATAASNERTREAPSKPSSGAGSERGRDVKGPATKAPASASSERDREKERAERNREAQSRDRNAPPAAATGASNGRKEDGDGKDAPRGRDRSDRGDRNAATSSAPQSKLNPAAREYTPSPAKPPVQSDRLREREPPSRGREEAGLPASGRDHRDRDVPREGPRDGPGARGDAVQRRDEKPNRAGDRAGEQSQAAAPGGAAAADRKRKRSEERHAPNDRVRGGSDNSLLGPPPPHLLPGGLPILPHEVMDRSQSGDRRGGGAGGGDDRRDTKRPRGDDPRDLQPTRPPMQGGGGRNYPSQGGGDRRRR